MLSLPPLATAIAGYLALSFCAAAATIDAKKSGLEARFLEDDRILRHNLETGAVLPPVMLTKSGPTAFVWDAQGGFVAYGTEVWKYDANFGGGTLLFTMPYPVQGLHLDGNLLFTVSNIMPNNPSGQVRISNRETGATLSERTEMSGSVLFGTSLSVGRKRLFGHTEGVSPSFLTRTYDDAGILSNSVSYSSASGFAHWTRLDPAESRLVSSRGMVVDLGNMSEIGTIGEHPQIRDIQFHGDTAIVVETSRIRAFPPGLQESGRKAGISASRVFTHGNRVWLYPAALDSSLPLSSRALDAVLDLGAPPLGQRVDPRGLAFTPEDIEQDRDGNLLLMDRQASAIYRWSPQTRDWLPTIPLGAVPNSISYSESQHAVYVAFAGTPTVTRVNLEGTPTESVAFVVPKPVNHLQAASDYAVTADSESNYNTRAWSTAGQETNLWTGYLGQPVAWDPVTRHLYLKSTYSYTRATLTPGGTFTSLVSSGPIPLPGNKFWVRPGSGEFLTSNGSVGTTQPFTHLANLSYPVSDATWLGERLYTIREQDGNTELQEWVSAQRKRGSVRKLLTGKPLGLHRHDGKLVVTTLVAESPRFHLLDSESGSIYESPRHPEPLSASEIRVTSTSALSLTWEHTGEHVTGFLIEKADGNGEPVFQAQVPASSRSLAITGLSSGANVSYRITALGAPGYRSTPSAWLGAITLRNPAEPIPGSYDLKAFRTTSSSVTLNWTDRATNESGYRLFYYRDGFAEQSLTLPPNTTGWTVTGLTTYTQYNFSVQAFNGSVNADRSPNVPVKTASTGRIFVSGYPKVASATPEKVVLTWADELMEEDGFIIYRQNEGDTTAGTEIGRTTTNVNTFTDNNVVPGRNYIYTLGAWNAAGLNSVSFSTTAVVPSIGGTFLSLSARVPGVACFAFKGPNRIERYDTASEQWLAPLSLTAEPTALAAEGSDLFVATGREILRSTNGGPLLPYANAEDTVITMAVVGPHLLFRGSPGYSSGVYSLHRDSGIRSARWDTGAYEGDIFGVSVDPVLRRIYGFGFSFQFGYVDLDATGFASLGTKTYSVEGNRTWLSPDRGIIATSAGTLLQPLAVGTTPAGSLGGTVLDLDFRGTRSPVISRGTKLIVHTPTFSVADVYELGGTAPRLAVLDDRAFAFVTDPFSIHGFQVKTIPLGVDGVNDAPVWMASLPSLDAGPAAGPMTLDLKPFAADPDAADTLAWSLVSVSNPSLFSSIAVNPATGVLTAVPHSHASGSTSVTVAATDLSGATTSASFTITIPAPPLPTATGGTTLLSSSQPNVFRQEITLTQPAGRASGGFDLVVSGLPADVIFLNPSSSAPGGGTVEFHRILGTGESATVVLEYSRPSGGTFTPPVVTVVPGVFETADRTFGLEDVKRPAGEGISFRFPTTPGRSYRIRRTSNLSAWNTSGEILKAAGTRLFWRDREPANQEGATPQFYRAEEVPE